MMRAAARSITQAVAEQQPTVLLFDWDNTLVDGWTGITAALNAAFAAFDKPLWTTEDTKNRVRVALKESFPRHVRRHLGNRARHFLSPVPGQPSRRNRAHARRRGNPARQRAGRAASYPTKPENIFGRRWCTSRWEQHFGPIGPATPMRTSQTGADPDGAGTIGCPGRTRRLVSGRHRAGHGRRASRRSNAVLVGDASHDGGVERAHDLHVQSAHELATWLDWPDTDGSDSLRRSAVQPGPSRDTITRTYQLSPWNTAGYKDMKMATEKTQNVQDVFLNHAEKQNTGDGISCEQGQIAGDHHLV